MRACVVKSFGLVEDVMEVVPAFPVPVTKPGSGQLLVRVKAASITPGDPRMISGDCDLIKKPEAWPYIPGGEVCGEVVEVADMDEKKRKKYKGPMFSPGDEVIGTWGDAFGTGAVAEYQVLDPALAVAKPPGLTPEEGASLGNSAPHAYKAVTSHNVRPGERVLVLGGAGGVGSALVQILKGVGAHVTATTTAGDYVRGLGADRVIDYTQEEWWEMPEFRSEPLDVIFDCAEGRSAWAKACRHNVLKKGSRGGRFVAIVPQEWRIIIHSAWQMITFMFPPLIRALWTRIFKPLAPTYTMHLEGPSRETLDAVMSLVNRGGLRPTLARHQGSPFSFNTAGTRAAFNLLASRRAHGKVVIAPIAA